MAHKVSIISEGAPEAGELNASINVTSLVDVMICLLIMFMVASPMMSPEGMKVDLPAGRGLGATHARARTGDGPGLCRGAQARRN